jgi:hypothetical protein
MPSLALPLASFGNVVNSLPEYSTMTAEHGLNTDSLDEGYEAFALDEQGFARPLLMP